MPFSRQIRSNSTSTGGWSNRPVNTLPLSVRICSGTPWARIAAASPSQTGWVRSRGISRALTQNREWSSIPVSALAWLPSASRNPPTTSICHSSIGAPRSHRLQYSRRRRRGCGSISPARTRRPVDRRLRGQRLDRAALQLEHRSAAAPSPDAPGAAPAPAPRPRRHLMRARRRPVRPVGQPLQTLGLIPGQPRMQRLPGTPHCAATSLTVTAVTDHRQHRLIPLLGHAQLPHPEGVSRISRSRCQPSAENTSAITRSQNVKHQPK